MIVNKCNGRYVIHIDSIVMHFYKQYFYTFNVCILIM